MLTVARIPSKPLVLWDGDCGFCRRWVEDWKIHTGSQVDYETSVSSAFYYPEISSADFKKSVIFIDSTGAVSMGAEAVFRVLSYSKNHAWILRFYQTIPFFKAVTEKLYSLVSANRVFFSRLTRFFWGDHVGPSSFSLTSTWFIKWLGLIYFFAFLSAAVQIHGLIGTSGILPANDYLRLAYEYYGPSAWIRQPTLFWLNSSDAALWAGLLLGLASSVLIVLGWFLPAALFAAWFIYLSFVNIGQDFMSFQWDSLLLETGFLAIFFVPWKMQGRKFLSYFEPGRWIRFLYSWLLFRLIYFSGVGKLRSADPTWNHMTALHYHFETQPLPTAFSWYWHHLPDWFLGFCALLVIFMEWILPFFIFAPRMIRHFAALTLIVFQMVIISTGNYGFFNLLTAGLCLLLMDDNFWPDGMRILLKHPAEPVPAASVFKAVRVSVISLVLLLTSGNVPRIFFDTDFFWPQFLEPIRKVFKPLHSFNQYGLFTVMTTTRPELVIEGSYNRIAWEPYEFKFKPGDPRRKPAFNVPHQPRLDWQMWFAALGTYRDSPWLSKLCENLLKGKPSTLRLLRKNPFSNEPPRYIRAVLYDYRFSSPEEKKRDAVWWTRERKGLFMPVITLKKD